MDQLKNKTLLIISVTYPNEDNSFYGSIFVKNQVNELKKYFNKVIVIAPTPYFPRVLSKTLLFPLRFRNLSLLKNYQKDNVQVYFPRFFTLPFGFLRERNGFLGYRTIINLIDKKNIKFDLIHAHSVWPSGDIAIRLKKRYNQKVVVTAHGSEIYKLPFKNRSWLEKTRKILKNADTLITVSKSNKSHIKKIGIKKCVVIPNGFDSDIFKFNKNNRTNEKKILLNVGNLIETKNQIDLILAINEIVKYNKNLLCLIIGQGPKYDDLNKLIKTLHLEKYVKLLGPLTQHEISKYMIKSDLFIFPSLRESFGIVQVEAMGCGLPVIAIKNGGSEEIITNHKLGIISKNDPQILAKDIIRALNTKWDNQYISKMITKKYGYNNIIKGTLTEYKKILN